MLVVYTCTHPHRYSRERAVQSSLIPKAYLLPTPTTHPPPSVLNTALPTHIGHRLDDRRGARLVVLRARLRLLQQAAAGRRIENLLG